MGSMGIPVVDDKDWDAEKGSFRGSALGATAKDKDFMALHGEARGQELAQVAGAAHEFEDTPTVVTTEVVVVALARNFVALRLAGQFHHDKRAIFRKLLYRAVHRGDAELRQLTLSGRQNLLRRKRSIRGMENLADNRALLGLTQRGHKAFLDIG